MATPLHFFEEEAVRLYPLDPDDITYYALNNLRKHQRAAHVKACMMMVQRLESAFVSGWWARDRAEKCREDVNTPNKEEFINKMFK